MIRKSYPMLAAVLMLLAGSALATAADATGTLVGRVLDAQGAPVANAKVLVTPLGEKSGKNKHHAVSSEEKAPKAKSHAQAVAQGLTDKDGAFTIDNVPAGRYVVRSILKGTGHGRAGTPHEPLVVTAGQKLFVGDIKLEKTKSKS